MNAVSRAGLSAEGVAFGFGGREVLRDLSLKVAGGHVLGVLGRSGSGKSTLLHLLMGLLQEQQGTICLGGRPLTAAQRRGRGGYVPQKPSLLPWRTVLGNLRLPLEVGKRANRAGHDRASDEALYALLERFGLADAAQLWPQQLSGGMAQRVAVLRAVCFAADYLFLDEPFSALDALTRLEFQGWLAALQREMGLTTVLVTHDVREALSLCH